MAKFTGLLGTISGKLGASIFARNKGGNYIKTYSKPTNPNTAIQTIARALFASAVSAWHSLEDAVKSQWNGFATTVFKPKYGSSGPIYSGFNAFVSLLAVKRSMSRDLPVLDIGGMTATAVNYDALIPDVPSAGLSGNILIENLGPGGTNAPSSITPVSGLLDLGNTELQVSFRLSSALSVTDKPIFEDAISNEPVGIAFQMSLPQTQEQEFTKNPNYGLVAKTNIITVSANTITTDIISFDGTCDISHLKFNPAVGEKVRISTYLVSTKGQTFPLGSVMVDVA